MKNAVTRACAWISLALLTYSPHVASQSLEIFAGGGHFVDIPGNTIGLQPGAIAASADGFVYANDINGRLMRINTATGLVSAMPATPGGIAYNIGYSYTVATDFAGRTHVYSQGKLYRIESNGTLTEVGQLSYSGPSAFGPDGSLFVAPGDNRIYVRRPTGVHETVAGLETAGFSGDGGPASAAELNAPQGVAVGQNGDVYVADTQNNRIRRISAVDGVITTFAGTGSTSFNGNGLFRTSANIASPTSLAFDSAGNLFVTTYFGGLILRIDAVSGLVTKLAGGGTGRDGSPAVNAALRPKLLTIAPNGDIYLSDWYDQYHKIRKIDAATGILSLAIGYDSFYFCGENVPARQVCLAQPIGLDIDLAGDLVFTDPVYKSIRKVAMGTSILSTWKTTTESPIGIEHDAAGNTYVASFGGYQINRYDAVTGAKTVVAGRGSYGFGGDGGPATLASLASPLDVAIDSAGNLYITDVGNSRVRKVTASTGIITTLASIGSPSVIEFEPSGNLLVNGGGCSIYRVDPVLGSPTRVAGTGSCGYQDPVGGTPATATQLPDGETFTIAPNGNVYLAGRSAQILKIDMTSGILTRVPAPAGGLATLEGISIRSADRMEFDAAGNLYISQETSPDQYIFKVSGLLDSTPPAIEPVINGVAGNNGWYRSNVQLSWVVSDPESSITSQSGCTSSSVTSDTAGVTFTCSATSAGGSNSRSVTIKRDTQAPSLTFGALSPAPDAAGWNSGDVTIPYSTSDSLSGVYSTDSPNPLVVAGEGNALGVPVVVTDFAGNSMTFSSPPVRIDRTPPSIIPTISGPLGNNGWYRGDVQLTWSAPDGQSELHDYDCPSQTVTADTAGVTFTCTATSAGGTATGSVTIKRDATAPTLTFGAASPAADANGWRAAPVSVPYTATDSTSGVATTSTPSPLSLATPGAAVTGQAVVTDAAGNSATFTTDAYQIDASPPTVTSFVYGTTGTNGWYKTDARVTFSVSDTESVTSSDGCGETTVSTDTTGTTFTCTATSAGGTTSKSVTIKRDATPPTLTWGAPSPAPNAAGWNTTDVSFAFTTDDAMSGVGGTSHPSPAVVPFDGPGVTTQITVWDNAGNSTTLSTPPVNIDRSEPIVNFFVTGTPGTNGWYTSDVQVTWQVVKAPGNILSQTGCVNTTVNADTAGTTFGCSVTSGAGTTSKSVIIKRDATPPTLSWGAFSPSPNSSGWNKTNVSVPFARADAMSGVASTSATTPLVMSAEGEAVTGQVTVTDNSGNSQTFTTGTRNIDKTAPVVTITLPANGANYGFYQDVFADFACTDVSLLSCSGTNAEGAAVNTKTAGSRTFKVTAKDSVAFTTNVTNTFNVASTFNFDGFVGAAPSPAPNIVRKGSLVPIRWRLPDGNGGYVTSTASYSSLASTTVSCPAGAVTYNDTATGGSGISFNPSTNAFTYNWQSSSSFTGCKQIFITLKDGSQHDLVFKFQ